MGGHGPPYSVFPQSFLPTAVPAGSPALAAPSASPVAEGGMLKRTQCTQTRLGAAGSGASGSSTMRTKLLVPVRAPDQASGGDTSSPSHVNRDGVGPDGENADEDRSKLDIGGCSRWGAASANAVAPFDPQPTELIATARARAATILVDNRSARDLIERTTSAELTGPSRTRGDADFPMLGAPCPFELRN